MLGVLGTLVRDRIHREGGEEAGSHETWGGIGYALEALAAGLPEGWEVAPMAALGEDLADSAGAYLSGIPLVTCGPGLIRTGPHHPRVELRYRDGRRISERISHIPPALQWDDIRGFLDGLDALYINLITGFELSLETALRIREHFSGPIYADLHSLFLALDPQGRRSPLRPAEADRWFRAFHGVQVNEQEFELLAGEDQDPWGWALDAVGGEVSLLAVTMEDRGAGYVVAPEFRSDPREWVPNSTARARRRVGETTADHSRTGRVAQRWGPTQGDSTGCGDVWGSTLFARLLAGDELEIAMDRANRTAAWKLGYTGAEGLARYLSGLQGEGQKPHGSATPSPLEPRS